MFYSKFNNFIKKKVNSITISTLRKKTGKKKEKKEEKRGADNDVRQDLGTAKPKESNYGYFC